MADLYARLRPLLFALPPETAHRLSLAGLKRLSGRRPPGDDPALRTEALGLRFANPIGVAAGFDKNAQVPAALMGLGFGFAEVGTLTPRPQPGNPRPRVFRLAQGKAVINRLGFNNAGHAAARARLARLPRPHPGPVGVNIGANKDSADRIADYVAGISAFAGLADYFTVNISSPNTPGLRALQSRAALEDLAGQVIAARDAEAPGTPVLVKIAPDITDADAQDIAAAALLTGVDGLIVSNTTVARPAGLADPAAQQSGGLSGAPLFDRSTALLAQMYRLSGGRLTLIGAGGVFSGEDAYKKIRAGAALVQLYTGLIYHGPSLVTRLKAELLACLERDGLSSIRDAVAADHLKAAAK